MQYDACQHSWAQLSFHFASTLLHGMSLYIDKITAIVTEATAMQKAPDGNDESDMHVR